MSNLVNNIGTYCVIIGKTLAVSNCPLPLGACTWKHRLTGQCCYAPDVRNVSEIAALVGAPNPTEVEIQQLRNALLVSVKENLR